MSNTQTLIDHRKRLVPIEVAERYLECEHLPSWFRKIIRDGISAFEDLPIPDAKTEGWREANLNHFFNQKVNWEHLSALKDADYIEIPTVYCSNFTPNIVYFNGEIRSNNLNGLNVDGLWISTLRERLAQDEEFVKALLTQFAESKHFFESVSRVFLFNALVIEVARNKVIEAPINIYFPAPETNSDVIDTPWFILILNENSQVDITVHYVDGQGRASHPVWVNATEVLKIGENAHLKYFSTFSGGQNTYCFVSTYGRLERDSSVTYNSLMLGSRFNRSELNIELVGENILSTINGLCLNEKTNHLETQQLIEHLSPNCTSRINWRGVGKDESKTLYRGKIYIAPNSQKSDSIQSFKGLSLSDRAIIDAKPQLEIYADDVRCTHGATVGPPPKELVYYFQARGIDKLSAQRLLVSAFVKQVLEVIPFPNIEKLIERYLRGLYE